MNKIYYYFHAGSGNHGCEAIVRSTTALLGQRPILVSASTEEDKRYKIEQIAEVRARRQRKSTFVEKVGAVITSRILKSEEYGYELHAKHEAEDFEPNTIAMSIGGDNYCYGEAYNYYLSGLNKQLHKRGLKTVLWGCSIEPDMITDKMKKDFSRYDLIVARESISYEILKTCNPNTIIAADPAFTLKKEELPLPKEFILGRTIGINLSPLIQKSETKEGITFQNYRNLISHILEQTTNNVALIPHVVCNGNDDREPLKKLYDEFKGSGRICFIEDHNCMQLKGYIARCSMFIGARTHATIAAYSNGIPTLVIGYSNKAKGIANDLFGTEEHYVVPVQSLTTINDMVKAFEWLNRNQEEIKIKLTAIMPKYIESLDKAVEAVRRL